MSNTPRTDAATVRMERLDGDIDEVVSAYFARTLERELIAARSATGAPVAWMYEESGERMFGHPDGYRPLGAVPLYAGSPPVEEGAIREALKWCRGAASNDRWSEENLRHQIITRADEALNRSYTR